MSIQQFHRQSVSSGKKNQFIIDKSLVNMMTDDSLDRILMMASECIEDGNHLDALEMYDFILEKKPDHVGALVDKGATLQNLGNLKSAIACYDKVLKIFPDHLDALLNKGATLHSAQKYDEAIACYDAALKIDDQSAVALAYKGLSLGESGMLEDAIAHFKKALSIDEQYDLAQVSCDLAQDLLGMSKVKKSKTR